MEVRNETSWKEAGDMGRKRLIFLCKPFCIFCTVQKFKFEVYFRGKSTYVSDFQSAQSNFLMVIVHTDPSIILAVNAVCSVYAHI